MKQRIKVASKFMYPNGISTLGLSADIIVAIFGGFTGLLLGSVMFESFNDRTFGALPMLITCAIGAFTFLFLANIISYVAYQRKH